MENEAAGTDWRELLTTSERARMLDDIARVSLAVGSRLFPDQPWNDLDVAAGSLASSKCPLERLAFIERALPTLTQAAEEIRRYPPRDSHTETLPAAPPARARRIATRAILSAVRRNHADQWLDETRTLPSADTPENCAVKSFLQALSRDADAVTRLAEALDEREAAERASHCAHRLRALLLGMPWDEVQSDRTAWAMPPILRMQGQAAYAQALRWMTRYKAGFCYAWDAALLTLPQRAAWQLYETWCFFAVLDALQTLGWEASGDEQEMVTTQAHRLTCTLTWGKASRILLADSANRRLALSYNGAYPKGELSRSHTMQPDISLALGGTLWLLDAKFKTYAQPGEEGGDIVQMHGYRDAIISADGIPNVARAWCLYAGQALGTNRPSIAYGDTTASVVGALCLRPGDPDGFHRLCDLLRAWLHGAAVREASTTQTPAATTNLP